MGARVVTVNEVLDGHVKLDIECLDRVYLNAYVPVLQSSGQVVAFMTQHLGMPIPSPALMEKISTRFRRLVESFAEANGIPWVRFKKDDRKADVMAPYLHKAAATGRSQVAAIGVAQEFQRVWAAYQRDTATAAPQYTFAKADRRVTCYYFYLWDEDFGPAFIKVCAYFPYPAKIWFNGHEWAKRQAERAGITFTELSNGFAACEEPGALQEICDRLQPGTIEVFAQRWLHRLPLPFGPADQRAGYWWEISMRQVEVSRTLVFDAPRRARAFFEALIADNLDVGRPANVEIIFSRHSEKDPGYPYLAVVFQVLGVIRLAPLFYAALGCLGLYFGGRCWLGRFGGAAAVGLYCSCGAAILFAWRDYMPTFTEASLIAAGTGALLWAVLAAEASARRRTWVGLAGFVALEAATFSRYTNIVVLGCAVIAVLAAWRLRAARLPGRVVAWWLASACVFGTGVATFNTLIYGGPLRSGYRPGEITFSLGAIGDNLRYMPAHLIQAMPMLVLGLGALVGIAVVWLRARRAGGERTALARRDLAVAVALAACWAAVWALYATYAWTAVPFLSTLQAVRFYVPALGAISLLGAWLLVRVPRGQPLAAITTLTVAAALFGLGGWAFHEMYQFPMGAQLQVVHGPGGTIQLRPGPGVRIGGPRGVQQGGPGPPVRTGPPGNPGASPASSRLR